MFRFLCCVCLRPGMVLNQRQVSLVVSDWESYLGSLFPPLSWVFIFCSVFYFTVQDCFRFVLVCFVVFVRVFVFIKREYEYLPRCILVLLSLSQRRALHKQTFWETAVLIMGLTPCSHVCLRSMKCLTVWKDNYSIIVRLLFQTSTIIGNVCLNVLSHVIACRVVEILGQTATKGSLIIVLGKLSTQVERSRNQTHLVHKDTAVLWQMWLNLALSNRWATKYECGYLLWCSCPRDTLGV
jgi:hypothetical protein